MADHEGTALSEDTVAAGLSQVAKTMDGTGFAFVKLDISNASVSRLKKTVLKKYPHVRYLNASDNVINDISPISKLPSLLVAKFANNEVDSILQFSNEYLQILDLSNNKLTLANFPVELPSLCYLNLDNNQIENLEGLESLCALERLDANQNTFASTAGIGDLPNLVTLNVASGGLTDLGGLEMLTALETLDASGNSVAELGTIASPEIRSLKTLNLSGNSIASLAEVGKLQALPALRTLDLRDNEVCDSDNYRLEVLILLTAITTLDGEVVEHEERVEAAREAEERAAEAAAEAELAAEEEDD